MKRLSVTMLLALICATMLSASQPKTAYGSQAYAENHVYVDYNFGTEFGPDPVPIVGAASVNPRTTADVWFNVFLWKDHEEKLPGSVFFQRYTIIWGDVNDGTAVDAEISEPGFDKRKIADNQVQLVKYGGNAKIGLTLKISGGFLKTGVAKKITVGWEIGLRNSLGLNEQRSGSFDGFVDAYDLRVRPSFTIPNATANTDKNAVGYHVPPFADNAPPGSWPTETVPSIDNAAIKVSGPFCAAGGAFPSTWYVMVEPGDPDKYDDPKNRDAAGGGTLTLKEISGDSFVRRNAHITVLNKPIDVLGGNPPPAVGCGDTPISYTVGDPESSSAVTVSDDAQPLRDTIESLAGVLILAGFPPASIAGMMAEETPQVTGAAAPRNEDGSIAVTATVHVSRPFYEFVQAIHTVCPNQGIFIRWTLILRSGDGEVVEIPYCTYIQ
jgi:hypothetical protein